MPRGYCAQPVQGLHDDDQQLFYQFYRVYGMAADERTRGAVSRQDEDLCFWTVTTDHGPGRRDLEGRSVSYAQARQQLGRRMTFPRFSSIKHMRSALLELVGLPMLRSSNPLPE